VVNLSSAAQAPVNLQALNGLVSLTEMEAYAQSKLALTMWSQQYSMEVKDSGPILIAVNPGSLLASKMVKEGFGIAGNDLSIGANILTRLTLEEEFSNASGLYFDNDIGHLNQPHPDTADPKIVKTVMDTIHVLLNKVAQ
jgi:NAD(P)-dependent dehydrogenase (short-subunit alcohol dehydrogenase family)